METEPLRAFPSASQRVARPPITRRRSDYVFRIVLTLHLLGVVGLLVLLHMSPTPLHTNLIRWDSVWYNDIRLQGYTFRAGQMSSTAFFPLFPLMWWASGVGPIGICLLDLAVFIGALVLIYKKLRLRPVAVLLYTAFPSSLFFYMPYTEALFFAASTLVLVGLAQQSNKSLVAGMVMGALAA